jgi:hypothetical protein
MTSRQKELNFFANCFSPEGERYQILKNEGGFLSLEQFQDKYGIISNFLEYNGLLKAIPMKFKEVIAVNSKLEKVCDRYVTVLNNTLKPGKIGVPGFL